MDRVWPTGVGRALACLLLALLGSGCMTIYHPLQGLQNPTLVDPGAPNLAGMGLEVSCPVGGAVDREQAQRLCGFMRALFENQGATVIDRDLAIDGESAADPADLVLEFRSRMIDERVNYGSYILSILTLTLVPATSEQSVAQTVTVYDSDGLELGRETYEWRMRRYVGVGMWSVNWVLDGTARPDQDQLTGSGPTDRFADDLYRQVSQLVFNARQRLALMRGR